MSIEHLQKGGDFYPQANSVAPDHCVEDMTFYYVRAWVDVQDRIVTLLGENIKAKIPVIMREMLPISYCDILELPEGLSSVKVPDNTFKNIPTYKARL